MNKDSWPVLQWSCDDSVVVHMVTNTLHCYNRQEGFSGEWPYVMEVSEMQMSCTLPAAWSASHVIILHVLFVSLTYPAC